MDLASELAQLAARHMAEEGLSYGQAKRKAAKQVGVAAHSAAMPSNPVIEQALRTYHALYMSDSQPAELQRLRELALAWLAKLQSLEGLNEPCLALAAGAVVNGTAGEHSPVHVSVYTDDDKHLEIALINAGFECEYTTKVTQGQACSVLVIQDHGVPIVITVQPRALYKTPEPVGEPNYPQAATAAQLQAILAMLPAVESI